MSKEIKNIEKIAEKTYLIETYEKPLREQIKQKDQQLAELKAENERLKEESDKEDKKYIALYEDYDHYFTKANRLEDELNVLQQQLKEKDEEIENSIKKIRKLNDDARYWKDLAEQRFEQLKSNTKRVCEKIRKDFIKTNNQRHSAVEDPMDYRYKVAYNECLYDLGNFLDQIEKGENR